MAVKKFNELLKSEVKKVEKFASNRDNTKDMITAYYSANRDDLSGFITIVCEICSVKNGELTRENDVYISICLWDRRKSFVNDFESR